MRHGTERGYCLKILCVRSHVSDREFIQFTAEAWGCMALAAAHLKASGMEIIVTARGQRKLTS